MREISEAELLAYHEALCASSSFPSSSQGSSAQLAGSSPIKLERKHTARAKKPTDTASASDAALARRTQVGLYAGSELSERDLQRYHEEQSSSFDSSSQALPASSSQTAPLSSPTKAPKTKRAAPRKSLSTPNKRARKNLDPSDAAPAATSPLSRNEDALGHITLVEYDNEQDPEEVYELDETPRADTFPVKGKTRKKPAVARPRASGPAASAPAVLSGAPEPTWLNVATPDTHPSSGQTDSLTGDTSSGTPTSRPDTPLAGKGSGGRSGFAALLFGSKGDVGGGGLGLKRLLPTWVVNSPAAK